MLREALLRMVEVFPHVVLVRAKAAQRDGHVLVIRLSEGLVKARVKGSSNQIYDVHFDLKTWPKVPTRCQCNVKTNCEHVATCLFALQAQARQAALERHAPQHPTDAQINDWVLGLTQAVETITRPVTKQAEVVHAEEVEWYSEVEEQGHDFFSYELGILIDGQSVSIVPLVARVIETLGRQSVDALADEMLIKLPLSEEKILHVPLGRIKPLIRLLLQFSLKVPSLRLNHYQLLLLQEIELAAKATALRFRGAETLRSALQALCGQAALPVTPVPQQLNATLRPYQHEGLNWLALLRENRFSGILADDMGLGKTIQTLALLQSEKEAGRLQQASLLIAPTSLVGNWIEEAARFTPGLKVLSFHGNARHHDVFDDYDLIISTYGLIQRDKERFLAYDFYYLILDEAQFIKNSRTKTRQMVQQFHATHRLCLTGTPLENHLGELWSLFHFLMPGLLGDAKQFRQWFRKPIEKEGDEERRLLLTKRIQPFLLRRTKNQVAQELPPKTEITHRVELTGAQRDLYEAIRMSMEKKVREAMVTQGMGRSHILLLDALLKLRQVCCDPRLLSLPEAAMAHGSSAKLCLLMELLDNLMEEGRRVLIFSQFTSMLKLIENELQRKQYSYLLLTGQTKERQRLIHAFQAGEVPIFLISLRAGGTGLNLTQADTVIHYDPWWNPAVEDQATDRSHRIGQKKPVFVYKLATEGTVEEAILSMQAKKRQLIDGVLSANTSGLTGLTEADLEHFFRPLA